MNNSQLNFSELCTENRWLLPNVTNVTRCYSFDIFLLKKFFYKK